MTEGYYPGSKQRVRQYETETGPEIYDAVDEVELGIPRIFSVGGKQTELYTVGTVARTLNRVPVTIRKWENDGTIPKALYIAPSADKRGRRRLYTREQVLGMRDIAREEGLLLPNANGAWKSIEGTDFRKKVYQLFKELSANH